jgi:hypothetical protein
MNFLKTVSLSCLLLLSCNSKDDVFPIDKKYWDVNDYESAARELRYGYKDDEKLPSLRDPETKVIVEKLTDQDNFKVVLDDQQLGLKHKNEVAQTFFDHFKTMSEIYTQIDRQDKYIYDLDYIKVWHFGLALQLRYFTLGNEEIAETSDDPKSEQVKGAQRSNIQTLIGNYSHYLDFINEEKALSDEGVALLADGIDLYFTRLVEENPTGDYDSMLEKAAILEKKTKSEKVKGSLQKLITLLEKKQTPINGL